jgi:hypothetical protein
METRPMAMLAWEPFPTDARSSFILCDMLCFLFVVFLHLVHQPRHLTMDISWTTLQECFPSLQAI